MDTWLREDLHDEFIDSVRACPEPIIDRGAIEQLVRGRSDQTGPGTSADVRCTRSWSTVKWLDHAHHWSDKRRGPELTANTSTGHN